MAKFKPHQTTPAPGCGQVAMCSGRTLSLFRAVMKLQRALPRGVTPKVFSLVGLAANHAAIMMQTENLGSLGSSGIGEPGVVKWQAGNYVIQLNISTANVNLTWTETYICRTSGAGGCSNLGTVGSLTGQSISFATTGVKQMIVPGALTSVNENDQVYVVCVLSNSGLMTQSGALVPNRDIQMPIDVPDWRRMKGVGT